MLNSETNLRNYTALARRSGNVGVLRKMPKHASALKAPASNPAKTKSLVTSRIVSTLLKLTFLLLIVSIILFSAANYFGDGISRGGHSVSNEKLEIVLGNEVLHVPENFIRYSHQRRRGLHQKLELYIHWPSLSGYADDLSEAFNESSEYSNLIFVTLEKRSMAYDMSGRISSIYKRFFVGDPAPYSAGLVQQSLSAEGGFIDEDLYYAAGSPYPFATRCVRENSKVGTPYCLRDIHISKDISVTYRFHKRLLPDWISIDKKLRETVKSYIIQPLKS